MSTDAGGSWEPLNSGPANRLDVNALAIDPVTPTTLYAGTCDSGVFKSTDAGATWEPANTGLTNTNAWAFAMDFATPATPTVTRRVRHQPRFCRRAGASRWEAVCHRREGKESGQGVN